MIAGLQAIVVTMLHTYFVGVVNIENQESISSEIDTRPGESRGNLGCCYVQQYGQYRQVASCRELRLLVISPCF
jgi:hypothetical protein